jgi:hypothetical protein
MRWWATPVRSIDRSRDGAGGSGVRCARIRAWETQFRQASIGEHGPVATPMYRIEVFLETDDREVVDRITDAIAQVVCPIPIDTPEHVCPVPWFIVTSEMDEAEARGWRELLNR